MTHRERRREAPVGSGAERTCARCGRRMPSGSAPDARWCSAACRRAKLTAVDRELERVLRERLAELSASATLCPSEIARAVGGGAAGDDGADDPGEAWRELMEPTRRAARRLVAEGVAEITQRGAVVDPSTARGPIRIRPVRRG
jgi:hypothetical protein